MNFLPKTQTINGTGRLAAKTRENERTEKRQRVSGFGATTGPLGTSVAYAKPQPARRGAGTDTWAA